MRKSLKPHIPVMLMYAGPLFHLAFLLYIFLADIISIAAYAFLSLAFPVAFLLLGIVVIAIPLIQIGRRTARLFILIMAIVYIVVAFGMPYFKSGFTISRLLVLCPLMVRPETSMIWQFLAYTAILLYILTIAGVILFELMNSSSCFETHAIVKMSEKQRIRHKGTLAFFAAVIVAGLLITGNQFWFRYTFTLEYDASTPMGVEYWIGADEQEYNNTFTVSNSTPIIAGSHVSVDISGLMVQTDKFYAARFLIDGMNDTYYVYHTWYYLADFATLFLTNINASFVNRLVAAVNGTLPLNMTCVGYRQSRLEALSATHAVIVLSGGLGRGVPQGYENNNPEFNATCWLYYNWGIRIQAPHGCGIGFLEDFEMLKAELLRWQDTRIRGPYYYRQVIEGSMYNVEKIDKGTRLPMVEEYVEDTLGWKVNASEHEYAEWYWAWNSLTEEEYWAWIEKWNGLIDWLYENITWPNGTQDESIRFKLINCGIQENLIDYFDGDPDYARYYHNLGYGTHFAVDGYMFYRGDYEPYWTYGYVNLLSQKPKNVPHEEPLVLLGCMNTDPYCYDYALEPGSCFKVDGGEWTGDVNGDGQENGFDNLILDIMMCGAKGIRRVNLWPGPGPRSPGCCDYREYARALMPNGDFFIEIARVLSKSHTIQFQFIPGNEHFWDKELVDIEMDLLAPKSLIILGVFAGLYCCFLFLHFRSVEKLEKFDVVRK